MNYEEQAKLLGIKLELCKECGAPIVWSNSRIEFTRNGGFRLGGRTHASTKTINNHLYHLCVCEKCFKEKFHREPCFGTTCESTKWAFNVSDDDYLVDRKKYSMSKAAMIQKYGEIKGTKKWEEYCARQAETNTFEYKKQKYGWTKKQFDDYNKSRAVTLKNFTGRYGEIEGTKKWEEYCARQAETKTWDYMVQHYGIERALEINSHKAITLENMIRVHGEQQGRIKYAKWLNQFVKREPQRWSKTANKIFNLMKPIVESHGYSCQYQGFGDEKGFVTSIGGFFVDFYIPELNIAIEYNGGVFHADPRLYDDDCHCDPLRKHMSAKDIRDHDRCRMSAITKEFGVKFYIIWELDYQNGLNIEQFIKRILNDNNRTYTK